MSADEPTGGKQSVEQLLNDVEDLRKEVNDQRSIINANEARIEELEDLTAQASPADFDTPIHKIEQGSRTIFDRQGHSAQFAIAEPDWFLGTCTQIDDELGRVALDETKNFNMVVNVYWSDPCIYRDYYEIQIKNGIFYKMKGPCTAVVVCAVDCTEVPDPSCT